MFIMLFSCRHAGRRSRDWPYRIEVRSRGKLVYEVVAAVAHNVDRCCWNWREAREEGPGTLGISARLR